MKNENGFTMVELVFSVGIVGLLLLLVLGPTVYGLILAFKASVILGIIALVVEPTPAVLGWIAILGRHDVCDKLAAWLHLPF